MIDAFLAENITRYVQTFSLTASLGSSMLPSAKPHDTWIWYNFNTLDSIKQLGASDKGPLCFYNGGGGGTAHKVERPEATMPFPEHLQEGSIKIVQDHHADAHLPLFLRVERVILDLVRPISGSLKHTRAMQIRHPPPPPPEQHAYLRKALASRHNG